MEPLSKTFNDFVRAEEQVRQIFEEIKTATEDNTVDDEAWKQLLINFVDAFNEMAKVSRYVVYLNKNTSMREILEIDKKYAYWAPICKKYETILKPE